MCVCVCVCVRHDHPSHASGRPLRQQQPVYVARFNNCALLSPGSFFFCINIYIFHLHTERESASAVKNFFFVYPHVDVTRHLKNVCAFRSFLDVRKKKMVKAGSRRHWESSAENDESKLE